jgi:pimeloyl-ACP methyl ester carboxylesterase
MDISMNDRAYHSQINDHKITVDERVVFYRTAGRPQSQPIVFLHGWGARKRGLWGLGNEGIIAKLSEFFYVVAPELPGFIRSDPPAGIWGMEQYAKFLQTFLQDIQLQKPILVGHSFGGGIATSYASLYPEHIQSLVLINASQSQRPENFYYKLGLKWNSVFEKILGNKWTPPFLKKLGIYGYLGVPWQEIDQDSASKYIIMGKVRQASKLELDYKTLKRPVLLIWGERDKYITPVERAKEINQELKNSKLVLMKGGHTVIYKKTHLVINEMIKHLPSN